MPSFQGLLYLNESGFRSDWDGTQNTYGPGDLRTAVISSGFHRWVMTIVLEPTKDPSIRRRIADLSRRGPFEIEPVQPVETHQLPAVGQVASAAPARAETVNVLAATSLPAGTFIRFANHDKLYMIDPDGSITPGLRVAVPGGTLVNIGRATMRGRILTPPDVRYRNGPNIFLTLTVFEDV